MNERLDVGITFAFYGSFTSEPIKAKVESVLTFNPTVVRFYDEKKYAFSALRRHIAMAGWQASSNLKLYDKFRNKH